MNDSQFIERQLGKYQLYQLLGQSDFSEVYFGTDEQQAHVAVKLLHGRLAGKDADDFLTRTAALVQLRHPRIVSILDFGIVDGVAFQVMEYVQYGNLRQLYPKGTQIPLETILLYTRQIADALHYVHEQGLVHRDIKPQNMLVRAQDDLMLSDFGTTVGSYSLYPGRAHVKDFEGTVLYAAPEQLQGRSRRASDQYALGVVIYEWLCGRWPFSGTFYEVTHQHLFATPAPLRERQCACPEAVEKVVMRALEKDPAQRFPSIKLFADELEWAYKVAQAQAVRATSTTSAKGEAVAPASQVLKRQFRSPQPFTQKPE